jgi:hypothetical protein
MANIRNVGLVIFALLVIQAQPKVIRLTSDVRHEFICEGIMFLLVCIIYPWFTIPFRYQAIPEPQATAATPATAATAATPATAATAATPATAATAATAATVATSATAATVATSATAATAAA